MVATFNQGQVDKLLEVVDAGLCRGVGSPIPGEMCIEAAVCFALGLPHGDEPTCVGSAVRRFKIRLNDSRWSSNQARAKGLRLLAVAQLGSDSIDQVVFAKRLAFLTITKLLADFLDYKKRQDLAKQCRKASTLEEARKAAYAAYAADAADAAYAAADAAAYAYAAAVAAVAAYAAADAAAVAAVTAADAAGDKWLIMSAEICLQVLKEMKSPGCEFLPVGS